MISVYLMRGLGEVFSTGLHRIANDLNQINGVKAIVMSHFNARSILKSIKASGTQNNIIVGHSLGAKNAMNIINKAPENVYSAITIDIPRFFPKTNNSDRWVYNFYTTATLLGGQEVSGRKVKNTHINSSHLTIDSSSRVKKRVFQEVEKLLRLKRNNS